jgi:Family of unknown function (DUF6491)
MRRLLVPAFLATLTLGACATGIPKHESDAATRARYEQYAGAPVDHITYLGHYSGWEPLGRDALVIWTGINDAYLLKVNGPCPDLPFATHVGLTATGSTVYARFDFVTVRHWRCQIAEIRPVDYRRMRADLRAARARGGG